MSTSAGTSEVTSSLLIVFKDPIFSHVPNSSPVVDNLGRVLNLKDAAIGGES